MMKLFLPLFMLLVFPAGYANIANAPDDSWTGAYLGFKTSVISTTVSNSNSNAYGFTTAAFGLTGAYNHAFTDGLILGLGIDVNSSPFKNTAFNEKGNEFYMQNQTRFFGSLLANFGVAINNHFAILNDIGIGYLKTKTTGATRGDNPRFSDHSATFTQPVVGTNLIYKTQKDIYGKFGVNYYIPFSQRYYSTVSLANSTLRKGLFQAGLEVGLRI